MDSNSLRTQRVAGSMVANEPLWLRALLIGAAYVIIGSLILFPLAYVFIHAVGMKAWSEQLMIDLGRALGLSSPPDEWRGLGATLAECWPSLSRGLKAYYQNVFVDPDGRHALWLTLTIAPLAVALNTVFGLAAAWTVTKFRFPGRTLLITMLDVPFAVSPVVAGLMFVLLFGAQGYFGPYLISHGIKILFAWPSILLATIFVTLPFVARELIPLMESLGSEEEVAAVSLGANSWQLFWRITLPNIKWGLLFGMIQCNARAIGEYGAVYVVSGRISGETDTMPLRVEKLFQEPGQMSACYATASLLTLMALATLFFKYLLETWIAAQRAETQTEESPE
jgi:sulfate transport system permease protein